MNLKKVLKRLLGEEKGVTLIELLAVIVIMGIIASIAVPAVMGNFTTAKNNTDTQNKQLITDAINKVIVTEGSYTPTLAATATPGVLLSAETVTFTPPSGLTSPTPLDQLLTGTTAGGPYLTGSIPKKSDGTDFIIFVSAAGTSFVIK